MGITWRRLSLCQVSSSGSLFLSTSNFRTNGDHRRQIIPDPDQLESFLANISFSVFEHPRSHPGYSQQDELMLKDLYNGQEVTQHLNIVGSVNPLVQDAADTAVPPPHSMSQYAQVLM